MMRRRRREAAGAGAPADPYGAGVCNVGFLGGGMPLVSGGDYAAPVLFDPNDRTCGSCDKQCVLDGKWNQSSAQRNIDLGIIREERRRRSVFADE